jgi:hypothetical protein
MFWIGEGQLMRVWEIAAEKKAIMPENEYNEFLEVLAYQYGFSLKVFAGVKSLEGFTHDEILEALFNCEIRPLDGGYMVVTNLNTDPIVRKYRKLAAN